MGGNELDWRIVRDQISKGKSSQVNQGSERFGVQIEIVNFTRQEGLGDMASTNGLCPPKVSSPVFIKKSESRNKGKPKPTVRVAKIMCLGVWVRKSSQKVVYERRDSY